MPATFPNRKIQIKKPETVGPEPTVTTSFDAHEEDCFSHRSGHYTRSTGTGTYSATAALFGVELTMTWEGQKGYPWEKSDETEEGWEGRPFTADEQTAIRKRLRAACMENAPKDEDEDPSPNDPPDPMDDPRFEPQEFEY